MTDLENKIIAALAVCHYPTRARYLPVNAWVCDVTRALHKLERMGVVKSEMRRDPANCEWYDVWSLVERS